MMVLKHKLVLERSKLVQALVHSMLVLEQVHSSLELVHSLMLDHSRPC